MPEDRLIDVINAAIFKALTDTHTMAICKVTGVNSETINCRSVINRVVDGESIEFPEFVDVPVISLQGGGKSLSFPIAEGDYCLLFIAERCFDNWWVGGDFQSPLEMRMHDYSDGFALVGINPLSGAIPITKDMKFIGDLVIDGSLTVNGGIEATGDVKAGVSPAQVSLKNHKHTGGTLAGGLTGSPIPIP